MERRSRSRDALLPALLFAGLAVGCAQPASRSASFVAFDTAEVVIRSEADSAVLLVEVASTFEQKVLGLSRRPRLDRNSGMLFRYDSAGAAGDGFWMWQTRMPLDIAFIDTTWVIAEVLAMAPCVAAAYMEDCPQYYTNVAYLATIEANRGWFRDNGVGVGSRVEVIPRR